MSFCLLKELNLNEGSHIYNSDFQEYVHLLNSLQIKIRKEKKIHKYLPEIINLLYHTLLLWTPGSDLDFKLSGFLLQLDINWDTDTLEATVGSVTIYQFLSNLYAYFFNQHQILIFYY